MTDPGDGAQPMAAAAAGEFGLQDILSDAGDAFKAHFGAVLGAFVVFAIIQLVAGKLLILSLFVAPQLMAGFSLILLDALRGGRPPEFKDLFKGFSHYLPLLVAGLASGLLTGLGLLCLVVPGIVLALMWSQTMFILADDIREVEAGRKPKAELSGWDAMQRSAALMSGHKLRFLGYAVVLAIIGAAGTLAAGIGALITVPFAWLAGAAFYLRLTKLP